jgi:hypothetical protein
MSVGSVLMAVDFVLKAPGPAAKRADSALGVFGSGLKEIR